jgi:hypothetical protein
MAITIYIYTGVHLGLRNPEIRNSSVGTAMGYGLDGRGSILGRDTKIFFTL